MSKFEKKQILKIENLWKDIENLKKNQIKSLEWKTAIAEEKARWTLRYHIKNYQTEKRRKKVGLKNWTASQTPVITTKDLTFMPSEFQKKIRKRVGMKKNIQRNNN